MNHKNLIVTLSALAVTAGLLVAGPLNPPAGPVASTYKTLVEVEPRTAINATNTPGDAGTLFRITQPGSYYLTGNITGVANKYGIRISAAGVTLDLNGFTLTGVAGAVSGIAMDNTASRVVVKNGGISGWPLDGIDGGFNTHGRYERLVASGNGTTGATTRAGIRAGGSAIVSDCDSSNNTGVGFWCNETCTVRDCVAAGNAFTGIITATDSTVDRCVTNLNGGSGVYVSTGSTVRGCAATGNAGGPGIYGVSQCTIVNCTSLGSGGHGIYVGPGSTVSGCTAQANSDSGVYLSDGGSITGCSATDNTNRGIIANNGCLISGCNVRNNQSDGISVNFSCTVTGNNCNGDGPAAGNQGGIHVLGQGNRIDSNNVTYADRGLLVDSGGNVIMRNTVKGCTINWVIAANNIVGPILDRTAPASAAISGNSAPSSLGSTDPNANFTY